MVLADDMANAFDDAGLHNFGVRAAVALVDVLHSEHGGCMVFFRIQGLRGKREQLLF